jgi:electron transport complex protein RnfD
MMFLSRDAPYWRGADSVSKMMMSVNLALLPVMLVSAWILGLGIIVNAVLACLFCVALEALALRLRGRPALASALDGSALITGLLIALAVPPLTPWWVTAVACLFAIVFAKHLYGGLGYNVFNPAMVGYVVVLVSFPQHIALWPAPNSAPGLVEALQFIGGGAFDSATVDAITAATPLDSIKIQLGQMRTMREIFADPTGTQLAYRDWTWINAAALAGGLWLLRKKVIRWHIPAAMLTTMGLLYMISYAADSAVHMAPTVGLFSGGTMLGAFFVATDPVSAATTERGRLLYGAGIGLLCFVIREWGAYPDGLAFAVLLMNMAVPLLDRYTQPRIYGHGRG